MTDARIGSDFEQPLYEFQQYLSDQLPPLVIADSMEVLLHASPEIIGGTINSWVSAQQRVSRSARVSDYFFHAVKKIHMIGEYHLVSQNAVTEFLEKLKPLILTYCPPAEREFLRHNLNHMADLPTAIASPVEVLYRQTGSGLPSMQNDGLVEPAKGGEVQRLGFLMQRIEKELSTLTASGENANSERQSEIVSEALTQAALSARMTMELERALAQLKQLGVTAGTEDVFRALGRNLPEWSLPPKSDLAMPEDSHLKAMHRIVTQAQDPKEGANRFHQMMKTAVERFNEGHLPQAVAMIDLAEKIIAAKEVETTVSQNLRVRGHENLDPDRLRKYAETAEQHHLLQKFLSFFEPLSPAGLLESLRRENKRDKRRLLLALLESHGETTRIAAMDQLRIPFNPHSSDSEIYFRRNLLYLLRRIPAHASANINEQIQIIANHANLGIPEVILKEAIACLGQMKQESSQRVLESLMNDIESLLLTSNPSANEVKELQLLLDRIATSLARLGFPEGNRILLDHCFRRKTKLGDTIGRIIELSNQDLSSDPDTVDRLLAALRANLPGKLLGRFFQQKDRDLKLIVEALSSTQMPKVRALLDDVARQFRDRPAGQVAAKILANQQNVTTSKRPAESSSAPSFGGDLDLFGLPALFQTLADNTLTGTLTLKTPDGKVFGVIQLEQGRLGGCEVGLLKGESALFQLFERPSPGTFQFARKTQVGEIPSNAEEVLPLMLEGIRRYDEFQQLRGILPDEVHLVAKAAQPAQLPEEKDGLFFRELWNAVRSGATPHQCETMLAMDSYRIRRLLVHWIESGSVQPVL
jgi:hypothetical protein